MPFIPNAAETAAIQGGIVGNPARGLLRAAMAIGLMLAGNLVAVAQKVEKQKVQPAGIPVASQKAHHITTIDQAVYQQKSKQLQTQIREDKKKLKTDKLKLGKDNPSVKASQTQLRKSEISLKQLQQTYKKGPKK